MKKVTYYHKSDSQSWKFED